MLMTVSPYSATLNDENGSVGDKESAMDNHIYSFIIIKFRLTCTVGPSERSISVYNWCHRWNHSPSGDNFRTIHWLSGKPRRL